jgi:S1-C subfamily serine protease
MWLQRTLLVVWAVLFCSANTTWADSLGALFKKVNPAVGVIRTVQRELPKEIDAKMESVYGLGSGVLISLDGKMLTAAHVVHTADAVSVEFVTGEKIPAQVVGSFPSADIAMLQLEKMPDDISPAGIGNSDLVQPGDEVMVIGAPYGLTHTLTAGHISGRHKTKDMINELVEVETLQSDAAVNRGNSGGPMFNMQGEVIGIVSHILSQSGGFEGISFAVASNVARKMLLDQPTRWGGVDGMLIRGPLAKILNVPQPAGYLVQRVADGSGGAQLGLQMGYMQIKVEGHQVIVGGDIVLSVDEIEVTEDPRNMVEIIKLIQNKAKGDTIVAKVLRAGEVLTLEEVMR